MYAYQKMRGNDINSWDADQKDAFKQSALNSVSGFIPGGRLSANLRYGIDKNHPDIALLGGTSAVQGALDKDENTSKRLVPTMLGATPLATAITGVGAAYLHSPIQRGLRDLGRRDLARKLTKGKMIAGGALFGLVNGMSSGGIGYAQGHAFGDKNK